LLVGYGAISSGLGWKLYVCGCILLSGKLVPNCFGALIRVWLPTRGGEPAALDLAGTICFGGSLALPSAALGVGRGRRACGEFLRAGGRGAAPVGPAFLLFFEEPSKRLATAVAAAGSCAASAVYCAAVMLLKESEREVNNIKRAEVLKAGLDGSSCDGMDSQPRISSFVKPSPRTTLSRMARRMLANSLAAA